MIVWLASYPRSGNTALRILLKRAFGAQTHSLYDDKQDIGARAALRDLTGHRNHGLPQDEFHARAAASDELFFIKTHDAPRDDAKAIYIVRDGRSAVVSYLHYLKRFSDQPVTLADVVLGYCNFGSWSEHFEAWAPKRRANTLLLAYDEVANASPSLIQTIADFVGLPVRASEAPSFGELQRADSDFFRSGSDAANIAELKGRNLDLFWMMHGPLMAQLGYGAVAVAGQALVRAARALRDHRPHVERQLSTDVERAKQTAEEKDRAAATLRDWAEQAEKGKQEAEARSAESVAWAERAEKGKQDAEARSAESLAWAERAEKGKQDAERRATENLAWAERAEARIAEQNALVKELQAWANKAQTQLEENIRQIDELRTWLASEQQARAHAESNASENRAWAERSDAQIAQQNALIKELQQWVQAAEAHLVDAKSQIDEIAAARDAVASHAAERGARADRLQTELTATLGKVEELTAALAAADAYIEKTVDVRLRRAWKRLTGHPREAQLRRGS